MKTAYIVVDLGFGDAGKGSIVDYLSQTRPVSGICRYTGGPHAAHHVVRADGLSHAFCQFGATFQPEARSHLARNVIVKPENLIYEGQSLEAKGVTNPFGRLSIHPKCRVVTSYHAMLCQMKEAARGRQRQGTVGIGAGEAVLEGEEQPGMALRVEDLYQTEVLRPKMCWHFENKQRQARALLRACERSPLREEVQAVYESFLQQVRLSEVLAVYQRFAETLPVRLCTDAEFLNEMEGLGGDVLFEGAHAALLDREHGYFPYVAKTSTTTREAQRILAEGGFAGRTQTIGVVRALGYRHGPGPFVTEDPRLTGLFQEQHNKANAWQGSVRYGWFDLLAARQGVQLNPRVDAIALTMLDHLARVGAFRVCLSYEYRGSEIARLGEYFDFHTERGGRVKITAIRPRPTGRADTLARLLFDCVPCDWQCFERGAEEDFVRFLESPEGLGLPVQIRSTGPTAQDKQERIPIEARF